MPIAVRKSAPVPVQDSVPLPPKVPQLPDDVLKRFPSLADWQEDENAWWNRTTNALQSNNRAVSQNITKTAQDMNNLTVSFNDFKIEIRDEIDIIIDDQVAQAKRIISVSAQVGVNQNIKIQNTAPVGPALNDYWIDNSNLATPVTYQWDGADWVEVTEPVTVAGVADERTARVTADGFLSGKYTLTVIAGNVVTGMNITSSTGAGTDVSSVIFRATDFQIYNGVVGKTMFSVSGTDVNLAGVLTVSTSGKVYTGAGTYGGATTYFYVDSSNRFSLGSNLTWDGATLTITGSISATTGTIGGWTISSTTLSRNNAILDSAGQLVLGTSNDVVYLSATDATYRIWIGNATAGSAAFSVTKAGAMRSVSGIIGGFAISSNSLSATGSAGYMEMSAASGQLLLSDGPNYVTFLSATDGLVMASPAGTTMIVVRRSADTFARWYIETDGVMLWGPGSGAQDTNLYRSGANQLTTDDTFNAFRFAGDGQFITGLNASSISSGTLSNSRLPGAISVTSLATANFEASITTAVDVKDANLRVYNGGTQNARIDYTTGFYYVQGNNVVGARGTRGAAGLPEVVALLDAWGAWA